VSKKCVRKPPYYRFVEDGMIKEFTGEKGGFWAELANDLVALCIINHSDWFWGFGRSNLNELAKSNSFVIKRQPRPGMSGIAGAF